MKYFPHTPQDIEQMLKVSGVSSLDELYSEIPSHLQFNRDYDLPQAMSEAEIRRHFAELGKMNRSLVCFAGAGVQDHYTPSGIGALLSRS